MISLSVLKVFGGSKLPLEWSFGMVQMSSISDEDGGAGTCTQELQITNISHSPLQRSSSRLHNVPSRNDTIITSTPECKEQLQKQTPHKFK